MDFRLFRRWNWVYRGIKGFKGRNLIEFFLVFLIKLVYLEQLSDINRKKLGFYPGWATLFLGENMYS